MEDSISRKEDLRLDRFMGALSIISSGFLLPKPSSRLTI